MSDVTNMYDAIVVHLHEYIMSDIQIRTSYLCIAMNKKRKVEAKIPLFIIFFLRH